MEALLLISAYSCPAGCAVLITKQDNSRMATTQPQLSAFFIYNAHEVTIHVPSRRSEQAKGNQQHRMQSNLSIVKPVYRLRATCQTGAWYQTNHVHKSMGC
jgi:hypothetical protein